MALKIYDTFAPQGEYPAVKAEDVEMPDGSRLSDFEGGSYIVVDDALSETSTNPVQNKVITTQMNTAIGILQTQVLPKLLPSVTTSDNGKVLSVTDGVWVVKEITGGSGGSTAVPVVDLVAMGLTAVSFPSGASALETDATAVCEVLSNGTATFVIPVDMDVETMSVAFTMNAMGTGGSYLCTSILAMDGYFALTVIVDPSMVAVVCEPLATGSITVDDALSETSENPVQNKVIYDQLVQANTVLAQLQASIPTDAHIKGLIDTYLSEALGGDY